MRRYLLSSLLAALLVGCGGKKTSAPSPEAQAAPTPAAPAADRFADVKAAKDAYDKAKAKSPDNLIGLRRLAEQHRALARAKGDVESANYFEKEVEDLAKRYQDFCEAIYTKAEKDADACLEWPDRYKRWDECVTELRRKCPENTALIAAAEERKTRATLMEKATVFFSTFSEEAKAAATQNEDPETAVAKLVIFRAWMRGSRLIKEPVEGESVPGVAASDDGAGELLKKADALIAEYEKKCVDKAAAAAAAGADTAYRDIDFLADFQWAGEGGEVTTEGAAAKIAAGDSGGSIELVHEDWHEFTLLLEVRLAEGGRLWFGARPQVTGDRKEYRKKCKVELGDQEWHRLRIRVTENELMIAEAKGEKEDDLSKIGGINDLPPIGSAVKAGLMIGLEGGVTLEVRNLKARVTKGGEGFVREDGSSKEATKPKKSEPPDEGEDMGGDEPPGGGDEPPGGEEGKAGGGEEGKTGGGEEGKTGGGEESGG